MKNFNGAISSLALVCLSTAACKPRTESVDSNVKDITQQFSYGGGSYRTIDQGWTEEQKQTWYWTGQGSMMMPYSWFLYLEDANGKLFRSDENMQKFGHIPAKKSPKNPDGLAIGFVAAQDNFSKPAEKIADQWVGFTCAACHTGELNINGTRLLIEGGTPMVDHIRLRAELLAAIESTSESDVKLAKLARDSAKHDGKKTDVKEFQKKFAQFRKWVNAYFALGRPNPIDHFGPGRLDAFGMEINQFVVDGLGIAGNGVVPNAPISYPQIWDSTELEWVQTNGLVRIPIDRNIGEAIGVFGRLRMTGTADEMFTNNIDFEGLFILEDVLRFLKSPTWQPDLMGILDQVKVQNGRKIFAEKATGPAETPTCKSCHYDITDRTEVQFGRTFIPVTMVDVKTIKTDPVFLQALLGRTAQTGAAASSEVDVDAAGNPVLLKDVDRAATILKWSIAEIGERFYKSVDGKIDDLEILKQRNNVPIGDKPVAPNVAAYKARPLNGAWATAPYLHNGSVADMYEMLLPPDQRMKKFYLGTIRYDLQRLGYVTEKSADNSYLFDTLGTKGNHNGGHDYGTNLTEGERWDLIEYLKSI